MSTLPPCTLVPAKIIGLWLALLFFFYFKIYLFVRMLSLHHRCMGSSLVVVSGGSSLVSVPGLLTALASLAAEHDRGA